MLSNGAVSGVPREPRRYSPERLLRGQQMPSPWPLVNAIHYVSCPRWGSADIPMRQRLRCVPHPAPRTSHGLSEPADTNSDTEVR